MRKAIYLILLGLIMTFTKVEAQSVSIPDANFMNYLKTNYPSVVDANNQLIIAQAAAVTGTLDCSDQNISSLEGIQYFTNIQTLDATKNNISLIPQISYLTQLRRIYIGTNQITSLPDISLLTELQQFNGSNNQLSTLPDLSANIQLNQLIFFKNKLTSLSNLSLLTNLKRLDVGYNLLTSIPDLGACTQLTSLSIDHNLLTQVPDLSNLINLTVIQLHYNLFSFADLIPYINHPNFSSFEIDPQKDIPLASLEGVVSDSIFITTKLDENIPNMTYKWYFKNQLVGTTSKDSLFIYPVTYANEGYYYCVISNPAIPGLTIQTDTFFVDIITCPKVSDFSFEYDTITCKKAGSLKINLISLPTQNFTFTLSSDVTNTTLTSNTGIFENLIQPEYLLTVQTGTTCKVTLPDPVKIPKEDCIETFITPDGDGEKDSYFFSQIGTVSIYDKNGVKINSFSIPAEWEGLSKSGKLVNEGYYFADINNGDSFVRISVVY